jgi:hypothetical protein
VSNNLLATAGEDYVAVDEQITFLPTDTQRSLFVTINTDTKVEANENFVLLLSTDADRVVVGDNVMTITITDDDGKNDQSIFSKVKNLCSKTNRHYFMSNNDFFEIL